MSSYNLLLVLLMLTAGGYFLGRRRAFAVADASGRGRHILHSRPTYYGALAALWCALPALTVFSFWRFFESSVVTQMVIAGLPPDIQNLPADRLSLIINDIRNIVSANIVPQEIN